MSLNDLKLLTNKYNLYVFSIIICLLNKLIVGDDLFDTHNLAKRMDLESCIGQFDVQRDMIIRTEESRSMGAKFLEHADLGSRDECLHLCCETDDCDVFVFEEKNEGTCFLFHCGPAQDFRCKFTHHTNYTSAVLTPISKLNATGTPAPTIPSAVKLPVLSKHELELASLKGTQLQNDNPTTSMPLLGVQKNELKTTKFPQQSQINHCSRFQFQCHSNECIAVYNACDGIPQCLDGSDEGPECPSNYIGVAPQKPIIVSTPQDISSVSKTHLGLSDAQKVAMRSGYIAINTIQHNREDPMSAPQWNGRQTVDVQSHPDTDSRIFSHKGGLQLQPIPNNKISQLNNDKTSYLQSHHDLYMTDPFNRHQQWTPAADSQQPPLSWPQQIPPSPAKKPSQTNFKLEQTNQRANWPIVQVDVPKIDKYKANIEAKTEVSGNQKFDENSDLIEYDEEDHTTEPPKRKSNKKHRNREKSKKLISKQIEHSDESIQEKLKIVRSDVVMEFIDHDGASDRPGGAVLSLTLGIIIMAALAILIGCRANVVRRRVRRVGKGGYAHDADFLVNGMYL